MLKRNFHFIKIMSFEEVDFIDDLFIPIKQQDQNTGIQLLMISEIPEIIIPKITEVKGELVLYYVKSCPWSLKFLPEFEKFEQFAEENLPYIAVTKIDCDINIEICQEKNIVAFPTVIFHNKNGVSNEYSMKEERTVNNLIKFVNDSLNST